MDRRRGDRGRDARHRCRRRVGFRRRRRELAADHRQQARTRAESVALAATHGGKVTGTEISDEESRYEVEVTKIDGSVVDVQLDRGFHVVGTKTDSERDH